jgi:squalene-hopene/tetraprenyl-beta-curcumene cyclase
MGGILSDEERRSTVEDLLALQRPDGGWAMASLADWKRIDRTPQNVSDGDGYGTGLVVYVLRVAGGVPADDPRIQHALQWIRSHQRRSGYWYTRSPKINDELSTYVGTVYSLMALQACEQIR